MPDSIQDINFQPKTEGFSYKTKLEKTNPVKILLAVFLPIFLFFMFLLVLNYFNIISLAVYPVLNKLPKLPLETQNVKPYNAPGTNQFEIEGKIIKFDSSTVDIKFGSKVITLVYDLNSQFYNYKTIVDKNISTPSAETVAIMDLPSNILKQANIGKNANVQYRIENNKNILEILNFNN